MLRVSRSSDAEPIWRAQSAAPASRRKAAALRLRFESRRRSLRRRDGRRRGFWIRGPGCRRLHVVGPWARGDEGRKAGRRGRFNARLPRLLRIAVGPEVPRTIVASLSIVAIAAAVVPFRELPVGPRTSILESIALTVLPRGEASPLALTLGLVWRRRSVAEWLWRVWRAGLWLKPVLRLLVGVLALRGGGESIRQRAEIAIVLEIVLTLRRGALLTALRERLGGLGGGDQTEVVFSVLQIILRCDRVSPRVRISRELEILFRDVMRVAAYFHVRSI